ncbi:hypothetical protein D9619_004967 [Psilocybe cf. subviscida]|uniref:Uncharacterized protein n=1 Tax=Psilocybe cf. subviscida TaxID=2480587 RepID=A0A8H5BQT7_9AGAR|nr:hypothetical protein D9619_004967 [Psilocybe cf. subviscida]
MEGTGAAFAANVDESPTRINAMVGGNSCRGILPMHYPPSSLAMTPCPPCSMPSANSSSSLWRTYRARRDLRIVWDRKWRLAAIRRSCALQSRQALYRRDNAIHRHIREGMAAPATSGLIAPSLLHLDTTRDKPPPSFILCDPALTLGKDVRDSLSTDQLTTSSTLYPPPTSNACPHFHWWPRRPTSYLIFDCSTGSGCSKPPTTSQPDYTANYFHRWWTTSQCNTKSWDVHICGAQVYDAFVAKISSDPGSSDEVELTLVDHEGPGGKWITPPRVQLPQAHRIVWCMTSAVLNNCTVSVMDKGLRDVCIRVLVKFLQPKPASYLTPGIRVEICTLAQSIIDRLGLQLWPSTTATVPSGTAASSQKFTYYVYNHLSPETSNCISTPATESELLFDSFAPVAPTHPSPTEAAATVAVANASAQNINHMMMEGSSSQNRLSTTTLCRACSRSLIPMAGRISLCLVRFNSMAQLQQTSA